MKDFFKIYKRYLYYAKQKRGAYIVTAIFSFFLLITQNIVVFQIGRTVDELSSGNGDLLKQILILAAILGSPIIFEFLAFYAKSIVYVDSIKNSFKDVFNNLVDLDIGFHLDKATGKLISKVINTDKLVYLYNWEVEWFLFESLAAYFIPIILLGFINPILSGAVILSIALCIPMFAYIIRKSVDARNKVKEAEYDRNAVIIDTLGNFETVRSFGTESLEKHNFDNFVNQYGNKQWDYQVTFRLSDFVVRIATLVIFIVGSLPAWYLYEHNQISIGDIVVVIGYLVGISSQLYNMFFRIRNLVKELPLIEDVIELLDRETKIHEAADPQVIRDAKGKVSFDKVTFSYDGKNDILSGLDLEIKPQETVALVGPSGGGKSTIVRTLMRYYDVNEGTIQVDDINIKDLSFESLRNLFGLVPQEPVLFNKSIAYNIGYALDLVDGINDEEMEIIIDAAKKAQIHDFIEELPDGYNTKVGERGLKLSGGQKQRVAIARVLIKNPKIIIFDEATSMLDSESETAIQKAFAELSKDKTTIIIAHRLSTITHCDRIFVVDKGKITESGNHEELLELDGTYRHLWDIQSGGFKKGGK